MSEREPEAASERPPGGPLPPAPPGVGGPDRRPDPRDPGPPITVQLNDWLIGDLGHARVDALLVGAVLLRGGRVGGWLEDRGITMDDVQRDFPGNGW